MNPFRFLLLVLPAAILLAGCGSTTTAFPPAPTESATRAPAAGTFARTSASTPLTTGLSLRKIDVGGVQRTYYLYVPKGYRLQDPLPVVLIFHGSGQEGSNMVPGTGFNTLADANGFLAVYPNGSGPGEGLSWNAGECCGFAFTLGIDEPAFVRRILSDLERWVAIDPKRIFATGFSNGGILSYRLGCDMADTLAAVAPVAGTLFYDACRPSEPVSVIHIHGSADTTVPFAGGNSNNTEWPPVEQGISAWAEFNGCGKAPLTEQVGMVTRIYYLGCAGGTAVNLYLLQDLGHRWPPEGVWPASRTIWDFFAAHPKA
jgi:polyhydroxybutyrate depolymerase